ncbi:MAG: cobalamin-independent methionine synthase II family protein [Burkholderiales bacterium]
MKRSTDRILTTHTGSLPRPTSLLTTLQEREQGTRHDEAGFQTRVRAAVAEIARKQIECGIDVVNDGEQSKPDYSTYIKIRLTGFEGEPAPMPEARDGRDFPEFFADNQRWGGLTTVRPTCVAPIAWKDFAAVEADIANFKAAIGSNPARDYFLTAVSPGQAARFLGNKFYKSHEDYLRALANVLKDEYTAIARAGFTLQVDCPDIASGWNNQFSRLTLPEFRKVVALHLEVLDEATKDVPPEQLRLHLCWGNYPGPHHHDIPLREIIAPVLASRAMAISFEGANPRHEHEWKVFKDFRLPDGKLVIPGVLDSTSNFIEHPEVVADRILNYASVVGRENVIAGTDCGFATFAGRLTVHPTIVWAKLQAMVEGARMASKQLWG